jgi:hypothetical protein
MSAPAAAAAAAEAAAATPSAYVNFLSRLHRAWPDAPSLEVSFSRLSVLFPRPMHIEADAPGTATDGPAPSQRRSVPNLASTLKHWAGIPVTAAASKLGVGPKPLLALDDASGHIAPGSMTLVLAAPGGGKTTLLKVTHRPHSTKIASWVEADRARHARSLSLMLLLLLCVCTSLCRLCPVVWTLPPCAVLFCSTV